MIIKDLIVFQGFEQNINRFDAAHESVESQLHLFQCEMKTNKIIHIFCTLSINIIQTIWVYLSEVKGHRTFQALAFLPPVSDDTFKALRCVWWMLKGLVFISGRVKLLLECTALLSRFPPAFVRRSQLLECWGQNIQHVIKRSRRFQQFSKWFSGWSPWWWKKTLFFVQVSS